MNNENIWKLIENLGVKFDKCEFINCEYNMEKHCCGSLKFCPYDYVIKETKISKIKQKGYINIMNAKNKDYTPDFINVADRIRLIRPMGDKFQMVGQAFEIGGITSEHYVVRDVKNKIAIGSVNVNEFGKYFVKDDIKGWSDWYIITNDNNGVEAYYRTDGKRVQVKINKYKAEASCSPNDNFNIVFGINLALYRCKKAILNDKISSLQQELTEVKTKLKQTLDYINSK